MVQINIKTVDKFESDWAPEVLFQNFQIRVVLKDEVNFILRINDVMLLKKRLIAEVGIEGEKWMLVYRYGRCELYLVNSSPLLVWKLQDFTDFFSMFEKIEYHKIDNSN